MSRDLLLDSLRTAVAAAPDDPHLRMHLARLLAEAGEDAESIRHAAAVLQVDPGHEGALELITGRPASSTLPDAPPAGVASRAEAADRADIADRADTAGRAVTVGRAGAGGEQVGLSSSFIGDVEPDQPAAGTDTGDHDPLPVATTCDDTRTGIETEVDGPSAAGTPAGDQDVSDEELLRRLDSEFIGVVPPMFVGDRTDDEIRPSRYEYQHEREYWDSMVEPDDDRDDDRDDDEDDDLASMLGAFTPEVTDLTLADVAGMDEVKARLEAAVLAPIRNPELVRLYAKSLRGGLLLYGPPGCGKTFIARALAGELGARLLSVSLADVLDVYVGQSERNIHAIFEIARHNSPCVIFLDEVDAIGQKRAQLRSSASRGTVNQLLTEMDGLTDSSEGVYVLGATNHPWDVDVAFRRPGRFDRMVLVLPPDERAREAVLRHHLRERPIAGVDTGRLARMTAGYSGADLAYVCESAAERALLDSVRTGRPRMIEMPDLEAAVGDSRPSIGPWLQTARNVAEFANADGSYDDLLAYLRSRRRP